MPALRPKGTGPIKRRLVSEQPSVQSIPKPPQSTSQRKGWVEKLVTLMWLEAPDDVDVPAYEREGIIIYDNAALLGNDALGFRIATELHCKSIITHIKSLDDAFKIADILIDRCRIMAKEKYVEVMRRRLPDWVKPWLDLCMEDHCFIDPTPLWE